MRGNSMVSSRKSLNLPPLSNELLSPIKRNSFIDHSDRRRSKSPKPSPLPLLSLSKSCEGLNNQIGDYVLDSERLKFKTARTSKNTWDTPNAKDLIFVKNLGCGNSGTVKLMKNKSDNTLYAVKSLCSNNKELELEREVSAIELHEHPNLIRTVSAFIHDNSVNIIQEYADRGTLSDLVRLYQPIPDWICKGIATQILHGLKYLHSPSSSGAERTNNQSGFLHRDLKPQNILINSNGEVKLADFGSMGRRQAGGRLSFIGTSIYMSPERIQGSPYNEKSDIWSYGLTILHLINGQLPFHESEGLSFIDLVVLVTNLDPLACMPPNLSSSMKDHIDLSLKQNPDDRPTASELISHEWIVESPIVTSNDIAQWLSMLDNNEL